MDGDSYGAIANDIMFSLMTRGDFTKGDFYELARRDRMPPEVIKWAWKRYLGLFLSAGYIEQSDNTRPNENYPWCKDEMWRAVEE